MKNCTAFFLLFIIVFTSSSNLMAQNNALNFDGTDDYVDFGTNPPPYSNTITIEAWIKTTSTDLREIVSWGSTNTSEIQTVQFRINSGKLEFGMANADGVWAVATSTASVNTGQWTHVAVVKNNTTIQLYINGRENGDATIDNLGALTLANTAVTAGSYGSATQVGTFTVDNSDRVHNGATNYYKSANNINNGLVLAASNGTHEDELWIAFLNMV